MTAGSGGGLSRRVFLAAGGACVVGTAARFRRASADRPVVTINFDDGPDPEYTPAVLDVLDHFDVRATFFAVGASVSAYPSLARRVGGEGHTVGNHTFHHRRLDRLDATQVAAELDRTSAALVDAGVAPAPLFRAPYGVTTDAVDEASRSRELRTVGWDVCVERVLREAGVRDGVERLLAGVRPGSVILAHDGGRAPASDRPTVERDSTVEALPLLLDGLARRGFRVGRLASGFA